MCSGVFGTSATAPECALLCTFCCIPCICVSTGCSMQDRLGMRGHTCAEKGAQQARDAPQLLIEDYGLPIALRSTSTHTS